MQKLLLVSSRHKPNLEVLPNMVFPRFGGKNGGVLSMRMQVILGSLLARPGSAARGGGKKGEFRDWAKPRPKTIPKGFSL